MYWTDAGGSRITDWSAEGIRKIYAKYPTDAAAWDFSNGELDVYYTIQASNNASTTNSTYSFGSDATHKSFINIKDAGTASFRVELALSATPGAGKTDGYRVTAGKYAFSSASSFPRKRKRARSASILSIRTVSVSQVTKPAISLSRTILPIIMVNGQHITLSLPSRLSQIAQPVRIHRLMFLCSATRLTAERWQPTFRLPI